MPKGSWQGCRISDANAAVQGPFDTTEDLLDAWEAGDLAICSAPMWASPGLDYTWASTAPFAYPTDASVKSGPRMYMPEGNRYTIDDPDARESSGATSSRLPSISSDAVSHCCSICACF